MIDISRDLLHQFRAVLRKSVQAADPRGPCPLVLCQANKQGLTLSCDQAGTGIRYHLPGAHRNAAVCFPASLLPKFEGRSGKVTLEQTAPFRARASWDEGGKPSVLEFDTADPSSLARKAVDSSKLVHIDPGFLGALDEAARTAARDVARQALSQVMLRGRDGAVIGTDGRQMLIQTGFSIPWKEDVLIAALPVFGCREIDLKSAVRLGRAGEQVVIEAGPWTFSLQADEAKRYPDVDKVIPAPNAPCTRLRLHHDDVGLITQKVRPVSARDRETAAITLQLINPPSILMKEGDESVEVCLERSSVEGPPSRLPTDRRYLLRAISLGFREVFAAQVDRPLVCRDARRCYVWMPLDDSNVIAPPSKPARSPMPMNNGNGHQDHRDAPPGAGDPVDPLIEAEAIRSQLQDAFTRTSRLIAALKQQRRQHRAVQSALGSLRRLRGLDG